jgi:Ca2+-binding RTX toxin-like protein
MLLAPDGRVFDAGPRARTRYLDTSGTGAWSDVATRVDPVTRSYGSAVMYAPGKVLVMGGHDFPPRNTAEVIDLNAASPSWRPVGSMQFSRRQINVTLLPDGKVLVTGGTAASGFNDPSGHVDAAELWDPATESWTTLASSSGIPRVYHSAALLLPDGRVLSTGGNGFPETEIYSPPYLFQGTRPTIASAPPRVGYGQSFFVETPDAATISKITMLRLSSVTHAFNQSQYINELSFSQTPGGLDVTAPSAPAAIGPPPVVAPPGYYLLFLLNGSGVPSVAKFVQLGTAAPDTTPPTVSITAPVSDATVSGTAVTVSATAADNVRVAGVQFKLDGVNLGVEDTSSPYSISTTATNGSHTLTAVARDAAGNMTTSAGVSVTVNNSAPQPTCRGRAANISVSNNTIFGGPDSGTTYTGTLRGTNENDVIVGTDANDSINGARGSDIICGGAGHDTLRGAQGRDQLFGERGRDRLFGGSGRDLCKGGEGRDKVSGCERLK